MRTLSWIEQKGGISHSHACVFARDGRPELLSKPWLGALTTVLTPVRPGREGMGVHHRPIIFIKLQLSLESPKDAVWPPLKANT